MITLNDFKRITHGREGSKVVLATNFSGYRRLFALSVTNPIAYNSSTNSLIFYPSKKTENGTVGQFITYLNLIDQTNDLVSSNTGLSVILPAHKSHPTELFSVNYITIYDDGKDQFVILSETPLSSYSRYLIDTYQGLDWEHHIGSEIRRSVLYTVVSNHPSFSKEPFDSNYLKETEPMAKAKGLWQSLFAN